MKLQGLNLYGGDSSRKMRAPPKRDYTVGQKISGFALSAVEAFPELFGFEPSEPTQEYRGANPVGGFTSQMLGMFVPYVGAAKAARAAPYIGRGIASIESMAPGPISRAALGGMAEATAVETARLALSATPIPGAIYGAVTGDSPERDVGLGTLAGEGLINVAGAGVLGAGFGAIGARFAKGRKIHDIVPEASPDRPLSLQVRALNEALRRAQDPADPFKLSEADALWLERERAKRLMYNARDVDPSFTDTGEGMDLGKTQMQRGNAFRPLVGEKKNKGGNYPLTQQLNRIWKNDGRRVDTLYESKKLINNAIDPRTGFVSDEELADAFARLGMPREDFFLAAQNARVVRFKEGVGKRTPQEAGELGEGDRLLRGEPVYGKKNAADAAAARFEKMILKHLEPVAPGVWAKRDTSGLYTVAKKIKGIEPGVFAKEQAEIAKDIEQQLLAAKRPKTQARITAEAIALRYASMGQELGISPREAYKNYGFTFKRAVGKDVPERLGDNQMGMFVGEKGIDTSTGGIMTPEQYRLDRAFDMFNEGKTADEILKETGWFPGDDGLMRMEIDDSAAKVLVELPEGGSKRLDETLQHPQLYDHYPQLRDVVVVRDSRLGDGAEYRPHSKMIAVGDLPDAKTLRSVLLHEIQHAIQDVEGWNWGESMDNVVNTQAYREELKKQIDYFRKRVLSLKPLNDQEVLASDYGSMIDRHARFYAYKRSAGEVEARNVQARADMPMLERLEKSPLVTRDLAADKTVIVSKYGRKFDYPAANLRGMADLEERVVYLFKEANAATVFHEAAHMWLDDFVSLGKDARPDSQAMNDLIAIEKWLGEVARPDKNGMWGFSRTAHEKFAEGFTQWLELGEAPLPVLHRVFRAIKGWLGKLYAGTPKQELSPDVKAVFGRMFTNDLKSAQAGDEWAVFRTDKLELFAPNAAKTNDIVMNSAYFPAPKENAKIGEAMWDAGEDYMTLVGKDLMDRTRQKAELKKSAAFLRDSAETIGTYASPTQPLGTRNPKLNFAFQYIKAMESHVEARVDALMRGARTFDPKKSLFRNVVTLDPPHTEGLAAAIQKLTPKDLADIRAILEMEVPHEKLMEAHARGLIEDGAFNFLSGMQAISDDFVTRIGRLQETVKTDEAVRLVAEFQARRGHYAMTREFPGAYRILLVDEAENIVGMATDHSPQAAKEAAKDLIAREAKRGRVIREGGLVDETLRSVEQISKFKAAVLRPGFLKNRGDVLGYDLQRGELTAHRLTELVEKNIKRRENYIRDVVTREKLSELRTQLYNEAPQDSLALEKRIRLITGDEGDFARVQNALMDKTLHAVGFGGKDTASAIVQQTQKILTSFQFGFGSLSQPILNAVGIFQTVLPQIAYVVHASPETLARNYVSVPLLNGQNRVAGTMGVLSEWKLFGNAMRWMGTAFEDLPPDFQQALTELTAQRVLAPRFAEEQFGANGAILKDAVNGFRDTHSFVRFLGAANEIIISKSEELNRAVTLGAGYELAKLQGLQGARMVHFIREFVGKTAYNYGTADRATVFTTPLGSLAGTFKNWMFHFMGNMLQFASAGKEGLPALFWQTAMTGVIGGSAAMPFVNPILSGATKFLNDKDWMDTVYEGTQALGLSERVADGVMYGLPGMMGVSLSSQASSPGADPKRDADMIFSFAIMDRIKSLSAATKDALVAYRVSGESPWEDQGVRDGLMRALAPRTIYRAMAVSEGNAIRSMASGYDVLPEIGLGGALLYGAGFNPTELEKTYRVYNKIRDDQNAQREAVAELGQTMAQAIEQGDDVTATRVYARALALGINMSSVLRSSQARLKRMDETQLDYAASPENQDQYSYMFND